VQTIDCTLENFQKTGAAKLTSELQKLQKLLNYRKVERMRNLNNITAYIKRCNYEEVFDDGSWRTDVDDDCQLYKRDKPV